MSTTHKTKRLPLLVAAGLALTLGAAWLTGWLPAGSGYRVPENSILVLAPYRYNGAWVFDDERAGLVREPFVAGVPEMIDSLVSDIPNAADGFRMTVSASPFPSYESKLVWLRGDRQGNFYRLVEPPATNQTDSVTAPDSVTGPDELPEECWICPALFKYYEEAPKELYVKADAID